MTEIKPITATEPACLGVVCAKHEHCTRYHAAEGNPVHTIGTCVDGEGNRPLFVELHRGVLAEQRGFRIHEAPRVKLERQPAEGAQP